MLRPAIRPLAAALLLVIGSAGAAIALMDGDAPETGCGPVSGGAPDRTAIIQAALDAAGPGGTVQLAPCPEGEAHRVAGTLTLANRALVGPAAGKAAILCDQRGPEADCLVLEGSTGGAPKPEIGSQLRDLLILGTGDGGRGGGRDLIRIVRGDHIRLDGLVLQHARRHCIRVEPRGAHDWVENLFVLSVKCERAGGAGLHALIPEHGDHLFQNEVLLVKFETRGVGGHALHLENRSRVGGGAAKQSKWRIVGSELAVHDDAGVDDIVMLEARGAGLIEWIDIDGSTIERLGKGKVSGRCVGHATGGKGRIAALSIRGTICYGARGGLVDVAGLTDTGLLVQQSTGLPGGGTPVLVPSIASSFGTTPKLTAGGRVRLFTAERSQAYLVTARRRTDGAAGASFMVWGCEAAHPLHPVDDLALTADGGAEGGAEGGDGCDVVIANVDGAATAVDWSVLRL